MRFSRWVTHLLRRLFKTSETERELRNLRWKLAVQHRAIETLNADLLAEQRERNSARAGEREFMLLYAEAARECDALRVQGLRDRAAIAELRAGKREAA
jgi:hypothetical protein